MVCCCGLSAFISVVIFVEKLCFIQEIKCLNFFLIPASLRIMKKTKRKTNRRYHFYLLCILFKMTFTKIFYSPINIATDCQFSNLVGYGHISGLSWRALFVLCYENPFQGFYSALRYLCNDSGCSFAAGCMRNLVPGFAPVSLQWFSLYLSFNNICKATIVTHTKRIDRNLLRKGTSFVCYTSSVLSKCRQMKQNKEITHCCSD